MREVFENNYYFYVVFLALQPAIATKVFDLDQTDLILLPVGQKVECHKSADILKGTTWVVDELDIIHITFKTIQPKKLSNTPFSMPKLSAFEVSCTRDCKIGEEFKITLTKKDLLRSLILETAVITIKITNPTSPDL